MDLDLSRFIYRKCYIPLYTHGIRLFQNILNHDSLRYQLPYLLLPDFQPIH